MDILTEFEQELNNTLPTIDTFHPHYEKALHKMLLAGGKRFRPRLLLGIVKACEPRMLKNAIYPALAVEYIHTYSLIHDDLPVMDNANLRRGEKTLHIEYDEVTATLIGDALNTHAFYLLSCSPLSPEIIVRLTKILAKNGGIYGMVHGQALDCFFENQTLSLKHLKTLHNKKTGALIAASLQMGAVIADLDLKTVEKIYDFGLQLGLLFQIQDDIIDATKSEKEAGKTTNNDSKKNSFVNLMGIEDVFTYKKDFLEKLQEDNKNNFSQEVSSFFKEILRLFE